MGMQEIEAITVATIQVSTLNPQPYNWDFFRNNSGLYTTQACRVSLIGVCAKPVHSEENGSGAGFGFQKFRA